MMLKHVIQSVLVLGLFVIGSLIITTVSYDYTELDILIGAVLCIISNVSVTFLFEYRDKISQDRVERINKNIHNGVWRKTMLNL